MSVKSANHAPGTPTSSQGPVISNSFQSHLLHPTQSPGERFHHQLVSHPSGCLYLYGGMDENNNFIPALYRFGANGVKDWEEVVPLPPVQSQDGATEVAPISPPPRYCHAMSLRDHPQYQKLIVYGGYTENTNAEDDSPMRLNDMWEYDLISHQWQKIKITGSSTSMPPPLTSHSLEYHKLSDSLILFGGSDGTRYLNDVWQFTFSNNKWKRLKPKHNMVPIGRYGHSAVWKGKNDMIVFGGGTVNALNLNDTLSFSVKSKSWKQIKTIGEKPKTRNRHGACVLDGCMYVFGGTHSQTVMLNDLWSLNLTNNTWTKINIEGSIPVPRNGHAFNVIAQEKALVLFGGDDGQNLLDDTFHILPPGVQLNPGVPQSMQHKQNQPQLQPHVEPMQYVPPQMDMNGSFYQQQAPSTPQYSNQAMFQQFAHVASPSSPMGNAQQIVPGPVVVPALAVQQVARQPVQQSPVQQSPVQQQQYSPATQQEIIQQQQKFAQQQQLPQTPSTPTQSKSHFSQPNTPQTPQPHQQAQMVQQQQFAQQLTPSTPMQQPQQQYAQPAQQHEEQASMYQPPAPQPCTDCPALLAKIQELEKQVATFTQTVQTLTQKNFLLQQKLQKQAQIITAIQPLSLTQQKQLFIHNRKWFIPAEKIQSIDWKNPYQGSYSNVYRGEFNDEEVAVKRIDMQRVAEIHDCSIDRVKEIVLNEVFYMIKVNNQHVVKPFGVSFEDRYAMVVMEWCISDLGNYIRTHSLNISAKVRMLVQIAQAMAAIHHEGIVHRDLKPRNILIQENGIVKIIDFGISRDDSSSSSLVRKNIQNNFLYVAPELYVDVKPGAVPTKEDPFTKVSDVYAFGMIMYFILTGLEPLKDIFTRFSAYPHKFLNYIVKENVRLDMNVEALAPQNCPPLLVDLVNRCSEHDPEKRIQSFEDILKMLTTPQ